jgi:hypothetical protein
VALPSIVATTNSAGRWLCQQQWLHLILPVGSCTNNITERNYARDYGGSKFALIMNVTEGRQKKNSANISESADIETVRL